MSTSPGVIRLATSAPRSLFETAFDAVWDPVFIVDAGPSHVPIVLANAAARREFKRDGVPSLIETSIYSLLGPVSASAMHAVLEGSSDAVASARQGMTWRFSSEERSAPTEIQCLDAGPNHRLLMLTLRAASGPRTGGQPGAGTVVDAATPMQGDLDPAESWLQLSLSLAHMHAWRWYVATDALEFAVDESRDSGLPALFPTFARFLARVHPKDRQRLRVLFTNAVAAQAPLEAEFRLRLADGRYRGFAARARPLLDGAGRALGLVGVSQDVTDRLDSVARVRESEALLRIATAHTADTLVLLGTDLRVRFINAAVGPLAVAQILGRDIGVILPEGARTEIVEKLRRLLKSGEPVALQFEDATAGRGAAYRELRAVRVRDAGLGRGISLTLSDVTERKRLEREILEASSRERHLIGRDLHDGLGQELTGVALMLSGLAARLRQTAPAMVEYVDEVVALVNQSIETTRGLARGLSPVNAQSGGLPYALEDLAMRTRLQLGIEVDFRAEIWPALTLSEESASHLYRIVQEALGNAARHGRASRVEVFLLVTGSNFFLKISDDGVGMPSAAATETTGMGLKIMRYRANLIGAVFDITSGVSHGTTIQITGVQPVPRITL